MPTVVSRGSQTLEEEETFLLGQYTVPRRLTSREFQKHHPHAGFWQGPWHGTSPTGGFSQNFSARHTSAEPPFGELSSMPPSWTISQQEVQPLPGRWLLPEPQRTASHCATLVGSFPVSSSSTSREPQETSLSSNSDSHSLCTRPGS